MRVLVVLALLFSSSIASASSYDDHDPNLQDRICSISPGPGCPGYFPPPEYPSEPVAPTYYCYASDARGRRMEGPHSRSLNTAKGAALSSCKRKSGRACRLSTCYRY